HPVHDGRMAEKEIGHAGPRKKEAAHRTEGYDVRNRRVTQEDRHLSEELAPTERRTLLPIHDDPRLAIEDDEETRSRQALPEDALPFGEPTLLEDVGNLLELWRLEVGEQGEAGERIDDLVRRCHPSSASRWSPRAPARIPH